MQNSNQMCEQHAGAQPHLLWQASVGGEAKCANSHNVGWLRVKTRLHSHVQAPQHALNSLS